MQQNIHTYTLLASLFLSEAIPILYWFCVITRIFISNVLEKLLSSIDCSCGFFSADLNSLYQFSVLFSVCFSEIVGYPPSPTVIYSFSFFNSSALVNWEVGSQAAGATVAEKKRWAPRKEECGTDRWGKMKGGFLTRIAWGSGKRRNGWVPKRWDCSWQHHSLHTEELRQAV